MTGYEYIKNGRFLTNEEEEEIFQYILAHKKDPEGEVNEFLMKKYGCSITNIQKAFLKKLAEGKWK